MNPTERPATTSRSTFLMAAMEEVAETIARSGSKTRRWRYERGTGYLPADAGRDADRRPPSVAEAVQIVRKIAALAATGDLRNGCWTFNGPRRRIRLQGCCPIAAGVRSMSIETLRSRIRNEAADLTETARKRLAALDHGPLALEAHFDAAGIGARLLGIDEEEASVIAAASDGEPGPLRDRMVRILKVTAPAHESGREHPVGTAGPGTRNARGKDSKKP